MIIATCPLRVSLFGGSTDNPFFVENYGYGSVISFTCDLKTYVTIHEDKIGYNNHLHKFVINYSNREEVSSYDDIKNDVVRVVLQHFSSNPMAVSLTSDIYSQGSGLASSSSYIIALIKAISIKNNLNLTDSSICSLAYDLETQFNPYCGYQDPYGCGIGGFKRIEFYKDKPVKYSFLPDDFFYLYDTHLVFTGVNRNSKGVLKNISENIEKSKGLLPIVDKAELALIEKDYSTFLDLINESWIVKKQTSNLITENKIVSDIDSVLSQNKSVLAHKLCGAGNGGFYLVFSEKGKLKLDIPYVKININTSGVEGLKI